MQKNNFSQRKQRVCHALKESSLLNDESHLKRTIYSLNPTQLAFIFRKVFQQSRNAFCSQYKLNEMTFSKWLSEKTVYPAGITAVRNYLLCDSEDNENSLFFSTDSAFYQLLVDRGDKLSGVVFVDGDNAVSCMDSLWKVIGNEDDIFGLHFAIVMTRDTFSSKLIGFELRSWVSLLQSDLQVKSAVDVAICVCATMANVYLQGRDIPFYIVSGDKFAAELSSKLFNLGRSCCHIDHSDTDLGDYLFNIYGNTKQEGKVLGTETQKMNKIECDSVVVQPSPTDQSDSRLKMSVQETDNEVLIDFFANNWKDTAAAFCRKYNIDPSNFSKWKRGLRSSRASRIAVIEYMKEINGVNSTEKNRLSADAGKTIN